MNQTCRLIALIVYQLGAYQVFPQTRILSEAARVDAFARRIESDQLDRKGLAKELARAKLSLQAVEIEKQAVIQEAAKTSEASVKQTALWEKAAVIPVYWENPTLENAEERQWVREAIARTWEKESAVQFVAWEKAFPGCRGIRILIADSHPHVKNLGKLLDGMEKGMELNFTFDHWCDACGTDRQGAIEKIAVHEFGHALGFAHEANRPDAPDWCAKHHQGSPGDLRVTIYDPDSVMNYCNPNWNNDGKLSELDIQAVRKLYGEPTKKTPIPKLAR